MDPFEALFEILGKRSVRREFFLKPLRLTPEDERAWMLEQDGYDLWNTVRDTVNRIIGVRACTPRPAGSGGIRLLFNPGE